MLVQIVWLLMVLTMWVRTVSANVSSVPSLARLSPGLIFSGETKRYTPRIY
ncbi:MULTISPECIES: hypothetical protein [unclassified Pseudomonas]|uniref:hypothetical protein n=1 Tax=unclassified Pseudomonas TaxID=196821 RepID=UPI00384F0EEC